MLRKLVWVPVLAIALLPAVAHAQFSQGDWEMTLTGSGGSDRDLDTTAFGARGSLGYFFSDQLEVGVRQALAVADTEDDSSWNGSTRAFLDYRFDLDRWQPFVGVSAGYDFNRNFGVSLNFDRRQADFRGVDVDVDTIALGGEYRF